MGIGRNTLRPLTAWNPLRGTRPIQRFARRLFSSGSPHEIIGRLRFLFEQEYLFLLLLRSWLNRLFKLRTFEI